MRCGPECGANGWARLAPDKACSVAGPGVNVFPLLAAALQDSQKEGGGGGGRGELGRELTGGSESESKRGSGGHLTLPKTWRKV